MTVDKINLEQLQEAIAYLEKNNKKGKKIQVTSSVKKEKLTNGEKVDSFRKQVEYGPKKFIKP